MGDNSTWAQVCNILLREEKLVGIGDRPTAKDIINTFEVCNPPCCILALVGLDDDSTRDFDRGIRPAYMSVQVVVFKVKILPIELFKIMRTSPHDASQQGEKS